IPDPAAVAVSVLVPAVGPRVHDVSAAIPLPLVVTGVVGSTVPLPEATWKVTATPGTGLPLASCTITAGGEATALPTGADWVSALLDASHAAAPDLGVSSAVDRVSPV